MKAVEIVRERRVGAPLVRVWEIVEAVEGLGQWFAFAERAELLEGGGLGRRQRIHGHWGSKASEIDQVVTDFEPGTRLAWRHEAERLDGRPAPRFARETRFAIELEGDDGGTLVRLRSRQEPASVLKGIVLRTVGRREVSARLNRSLDRLAELAL